MPNPKIADCVNVSSFYFYSLRKGAGARVAQATDNWRARQIIHALGMAKYDCSNVGHRQRMSHLDFIAFGVPRSGTSALAYALNLHPDILCGVERFRYKTEPRSIVFPQSFRDPTHFCAPNKLEVTNKYLNLKGDNVSFAGDKNPRYYCCLDKWKFVTPPVKKIAIYRSPYHYLPSWRRRAEARRNWPPEQIGAFGIFELFALLRACLDHGEDTLFIPYDACFFDNPDTINAAVRHIGADPPRYDHETFVRRLFARSPQAPERPKLTDDEAALLDAARVEAIDAILLRKDAFFIGECRVEIEDYMANVTPRLGELTEQWLQERLSRQFDRFLRYWVAEFPGLSLIPNPDAVPPTFRHYAAHARTRRARLASVFRRCAIAGKHMLHGRFRPFGRI